ncbi:hypothetical protein [Mucilaginibacter sp. HD30]
MKKIFFYIALFMSLQVSAQDKLPVVYLPAHLTVHFISPEPIQYADLSSGAMAGDLPLKNVLRIRMKDSVAGVPDAVVTIAGEKFIAQYRILPGKDTVSTEILITPDVMTPLDISGIGFSQTQLKSLAFGVFTEKPWKGHTEGILLWNFRKTQSRVCCRRIPLSGHQL